MLVDREEVDRETYRPQDSQRVLHVRRNGLGRARSQHDREQWFGRYDNPQFPMVHDNSIPYVACRPVGSKKARRYRALIHFWGGANRAEALGQLGSVTERAVDRCPEPCSPSLGLQHPCPDLERWPMAEVLIMTAGEMGDPVRFRILVVAGDDALHAKRLPGVAIRFMRDC